MNFKDVNYIKLGECIMGKIIVICISEKRGIVKKNIGECNIIEGFGLENDVYGGNWYR